MLWEVKVSMYMGPWTVIEEIVIPDCQGDNLFTVHSKLKIQSLS